MLWRTKRARGGARTGARRGRVSAKSLRLEPLESRQMLSGNISAVVVGTELQINAFPPPNDVYDSQIQLWQQASVDNAFYLKGLDNESINGNAPGTVLLFGGSVNPVTDITVKLGAGTDAVTFLAQGTATSTGTFPAASRSHLTGALKIYNRGSGDTNTLTDVQVGGDLLVAKDVPFPFSGTSVLTVTNCIVGGTTTVDNNVGGSNGSSRTYFYGCDLRRGLAIANGVGEDIVYIDGSRVGIANNGATTINNGDGQNKVRFSTYIGYSYTGNTNAAGLGGTLYGDLTIISGVGLTGRTDAAVLTRLDVKGRVAISSTSGASSTAIGDESGIVGTNNGSTLGSSVTVGGPVTVSRGPGYDVFSMVESTAQWGLSITNNVGAPGHTEGSSTTINKSSVGTIPLPIVNPGLAITGDDGVDKIDITDTSVGGGAVINTNDGADQVTITRTPIAANTITLNGITITCANGADVVKITDSPIAGAAVINLGGVDGSTINKVTLESTLGLGTQRTSFGTLVINGGAGQDQVWISKIDVAISTTIQLGDEVDYVNIDYGKTGSSSAKLSSLGITIIDGGLPNVPGVDPDELDYGPIGGLYNIQWASAAITNFGTVLTPGP